MTWAITLLCMGVGVGARPPTQTKVQNETYWMWANQAQALSNAARPQLIAALDDPKFRDEIKTLSCAQNSSETLLRMLDAEIYFSEFFHNIPFSVMADAMDEMDKVARNGTLRGVPFDVVNRVKYLPTIWQEVAEGIVQWNPSWEYYNIIQVGIMKYPNFALPPPAANANDRPVYTSWNIWKKSAGNLEFGDIALVLDRVGLEKRIFISPLDTGCYYNQCGAKAEAEGEDGGKVRMAGEKTYGNISLLRDRRRRRSPSAISATGPFDCGGAGLPCTTWNRKFGSIQHFYHLVLTHVTWWKCSLGGLFMRWYAGHDVCPDVKSGQGAFLEGDFSGSWLIPENLKYVVVKYSDFFGKPKGKQLLTWAKGLKRPLAYGDDDHTGTVLDASVGSIDGYYNVTQKDRDVVNALWSQTISPTWDAFHKNITYNLHLYYRGYYAEQGHYCSESKCPNCHFLGANHYHVCLFWRDK